jgi:hypothetical protein
MKNNLELMLDKLLVSSYTDGRTREKIFCWINRGKTMRLYNYTPHTINIINGSVKVELPSVGVIRAKSVQTQVGTIYHTESAGVEYAVPEYKLTFGEPEGMPEDIDPDGVYVVSTIAAQALKQAGWAGTYMVTCGAIRDEQGRIIGCQGLARI